MTRLSRRDVLIALTGAGVGLGLARLPVASRDAVNESQEPMRQTRKRGRHELTPTPPPPPPSGDVLSINTAKVIRPMNLEMGVHLVNSQFTMADPTNAIARMGLSARWVCMHTQYFANFGGNGTIAGVWQDSAIPPDPAVAWGQMPWTHLDNWIDKAHAAGITQIMLTFLAPSWMLPGGVDGQADWGAVARAFPANAHFADYAELMKRIVQRYGTMCSYCMTNEWKGLWDGTVAGTNPTSQRWRYEDFTTMWNLGWTAIKNANPGAQFGGVYLGYPHTSSGNKGTLAANNLLLYDAPPEGWGGWVDKRRLDAVNYWLAHNIGYDFYCLDQGYRGGKEVITWLRSRGMNKDVYWIEFYAGIDTGIVQTDVAQLAENYRNIAYAGGRVIFSWGPEQGSAGAGNAVSNAVWTANNAATELPNGKMMRFVTQNFPKGTSLVEVVTNNYLVTGLASPSKLMLINRQDVSTNVSVIVNSGTPTVTTVPAQDAVVRDIP